MVQKVTKILLTGTTELIKHENEKAGTQLIVTGMSRLTYCLHSTVENPLTPQQHYQIEVWPLVVEHIAK